jgi:hypothetical protein
MIIIPPAPGLLRATWEGLIDVGHETQNDTWTLIGGQMVLLLGLEHGATPPRVSADLDTVVDVRLQRQGLQRYVAALGRLGFESAGVSPEGIAHRFQRGDIRIDVLAPEGTGSRADLRTVGKATTIGVKGGTYALRRSRQVEVQVGERTGTVPCPDLAGGILIKTRAAQDERSLKGPERHYQDLAFLLTLVTDPSLVRGELGHRNRQHLRRARDNMGDTHSVWGLLSRADASRAIAALDLICRV